MISIIKYNAGNSTSLKYALSRIGAEAIITDDPELITKAGKVIFPGVGEASSAMAYLKEKGLDETIRNLTQPVLGICLGMQLMCNYSHENNTPGLCIFNTMVKQFPPVLKVPHVGWNTVKERGKSYDAYFVHSYYAELCRDTISTTNYILPFSAALQSDNFFGVQFHPEKSAGAGEAVLKNFLAL